MTRNDYLKNMSTKNNETCNSYLKRSKILSEKGTLCFGTHQREWARFILQKMMHTSPGRLSAYLYEMKAWNFNNYSKKNMALAFTIYIQCIYGMFCRYFMNFTVTCDGLYLRFWPTLEKKYLVPQKWLQSAQWRMAEEEEEPCACVHHHRRKRL